MKSDTDVIEELDFGRSGGTPPPPRRGLGFYLRGTWLFSKRMWPALYNLSTSETYVFASAIAFNILISFFPFVVLIGSVLVNVLGWRHAYETIYRLMIAMVPVDVGVLFRSLDQVTRGPTGKAGFLSFGLLALSSSGIFLPIELALNRAYGFEKPRGAIKQYLTYTILVVVAGVVVTAAASLISYFDSLLGLTAGPGRARQYLFNLMGLATALPFLIILFFLIYYVVPHGKVEARQIFFTSAATTILVLAATFLFRVSLPLLDLRTTYRDLYRAMAVVIWVFILSFILILGANLSAYQVLPRSWTGKQPHE